VVTNSFDHVRVSEPQIRVWVVHSPLPSLSQPCSTYMVCRRQSCMWMKFFLFLFIVHFLSLLPLVLNNLNSISIVNLHKCLSGFSI
jgi:hypothetical protein